MTDDRLRSKPLACSLGGHLMRLLLKRPQLGHLNSPKSFLVGRLSENDNGVQARERHSSLLWLQKDLNWTKQLNRPSSKWRPNLRAAANRFGAQSSAQDPSNNSFVGSPLTCRPAAAGRLDLEPSRRPKPAEMGAHEWRSNGQNF